MPGSHATIANAPYRAYMDRGNWRCPEGGSHVPSMWSGEAGSEVAGRCENGG